MPAFLTHYACGVCGYRTLPDGWLKKAIRRHTGVFNTGLAGPDLFFYSAVEFRRHGMTIGRAMHKYRTGAFLHNMLDRALKMQGTDRETALVYYAGFVGHYSLDSNAHAFVYRTCHDPDPAVALGKHFRYEAGMDVLCCARMLGRDITRSGQMGLIRLRRSERRVIAALLSGAAGDTYGEEIPSTSVRRIRAILAEYYLISGLLIDPSGFREWGFLQASRTACPTWPAWRRCCAPSACA